MNKNKIVVMEIYNLVIPFPKSVVQFASVFASDAMEYKSVIFLVIKVITF